MKSRPASARSVAEQGVAGLKWNYIGSILRYAIQFAAGIVLARLLGPEPVGVMAVALVLIGLGAMIADFGLTSALVQKSVIEPEDVEFVSMLQISIGIALTGTLFLAANPLADLFRIHSAAPVLRAISFIFVLQSIGLASAAVLRRQMKFGKLQAVQVTSYLVGYALIGCILAALDFGVWSLVAAQLSQSLIQSALLLCAVPHRLFSAFKGGRFVTHFGVKSLLTGALSWMFTSLDNAVLGRYFGAESLGLFNRTSLTISAPTNVIVSGLQPVLFSALAKRQENLEQIRRVYIGLMGVVSYLLMPIFATIAVIPGTFVVGIYGSNWIAAEAFVLPLSLIQPTYALMALGGPVLMSIDKVSAEARAQALSLLAFVVALGIAVQFSAAAVVWASVFACACRFALVTSAVLRTIGERWSYVGKALFGPAIFAVLAAGAALLIEPWCRSFNLQPAVTLILVFALQALWLLPAFLIASPRISNPRVAWVLAHLPLKLIPGSRRSTKKVAETAF